MAVPKRKTSKSRRDKRRTHYKLTVPGISTCPKCGEAKLPHRVCKSCGTYKDKEVISVEA
ncbi:50S ribosomal protein L32 [Alkalibacter rhizosphaerae]|uniref:Large ribosomal subunit protein bL32 n=1 Tax=Alkalibacter rhizosphaerae TaxID=2815577 RepID=A0A974XMQ2_9FIRM|nr:50S ribosomal protein L32 [Alkalibacter rhizosphaerae]QSX08731.1 50S ribosomal protein L32 [Alkalibacter rhizosphaerae]